MKIIMTATLMLFLTVFAAAEPDQLVILRTHALGLE